MKVRQTKEERLATVMAGREDRSFMARSALKQKKVSHRYFLPFVSVCLLDHVSFTFLFVSLF